MAAAAAAAVPLGPLTGYLHTMLQYSNEGGRCNALVFSTDSKSPVLLQGKVRGEGHWFLQRVAEEFVGGLHFDGQDGPVAKILCGVRSSAVITIVIRNSDKNSNNNHRNCQDQNMYGHRRHHLQVLCIHCRPISKVFFPRNFHQNRNSATKKSIGALTCIGAAPFALSSRWSSESWTWMLPMRLLQLLLLMMKTMMMTMMGQILDSAARSSSLAAAVGRCCVRAPRIYPIPNKTVFLYYVWDHP